MRYFNTSGPCRPAEHYTVFRNALLEKGRREVERGRYFTIFAPRQAGKTTYFQLLIERLGNDAYTPIWVSFENLSGVTKELFYRDLNLQLRQELAEQGVDHDGVIENPVDLTVFFQELRSKASPVVLFIDEFEGVPESVFPELMHTFRRMYHRRKYHALHSLALVGVSTTADLVLSGASPFNVVDELTLPYFTFDEVVDLTGQHAAESGQPFDPGVIRAIYENSRGQPGLVCGLCAHLVEEIAVDRSRPATMADFYKTLDHYLTRKFDKNIINVVQKAREKKRFMLRLLFSETPIPFTVDDPDIAYLYANGVVDNVDGYVGIPVPLYAKRLIAAFRPLFNGEAEYFLPGQDSLAGYATADGLNMRAILGRYRDYVRRRGFRAFDADKLKEAAWHYSLDGFINFFIERLGGRTFIEVPSGRGRTDILILYGKRKYIIETKIYTDDWYFRKGKTQLSAYLHSEGVDEGFYVVFSRKHADADSLTGEEIVEEKRIVTYIIQTDFERPSG
jgi:hypothetical protein